MIWWTGLEPREFEFPFPGSLAYTFLLRTPCGMFSKVVDYNQQVVNKELSLVARDTPVGEAFDGVVDRCSLGCRFHLLH